MAPDGDGTVEPTRCEAGQHNNTDDQHPDPDHPFTIDRVVTMWGCSDRSVDNSVRMWITQSSPARPDGGPNLRGRRRRVRSGLRGAGRMRSCVRSRGGRNLVWWRQACSSTSDDDVLGDESLGDEAAQSGGGAEQGVVAGTDGRLLDSFGLAPQHGVHIGRGVWSHQRRCYRWFRQEFLQEPAGYRERRRVDGQSVAAAVDDRAGADDVAPGAAGVDMPAEMSSGVAQIDLGRQAEVQMLPAAGYLRFDLELCRSLQVRLFLRLMPRGAAIARAGPGLASSSSNVDGWQTARLWSC